MHENNNLDHSRWRKQ